MKKILWLSHLVPYPPKGGVLQRSYNLIREVSRYNNVTLLAFNQTSLVSSQALLDEAKAHFSQFCHVEGIVPISSETSRLNQWLLLMKGLLPTKTYTVSWLESKLFEQKLEALLARENFDVIHVDTISLVPYVAKCKNAKIVLNHHNIESLMLLRRAENETNWLKKFYFWQEGRKLMRYERKVCNTFSLNVTCSHLDTDRLKTIAPGINGIDVANGVVLNYFQPIDCTKVEKSLVFAGGLSWYPNLDAMSFFLRKVWPRLVAEVPNISLTVIGRNPPEWMLALQAEYPTLKVTGFVDDVRPYLSQAHIYVCPIRDGGGTKLKVLDALAMLMPLVADPIACEGIDVIDGESVIYASTPEDYVDSIKKLINDPQLCKTVADNGAALIQNNYSFESLGKKLSDAYHQL